MAPRRKKQPPPYGREFSIRLPEDVADRIRAKAEREGRPINRVVTNELASIPYLEKVAEFANQVEEMKIVLAKQGKRITWLDLSEELLHAIDAVLATQQGSAQQAALDEVRRIRSEMLKTGKANP